MATISQPPGSILPEHQIMEELIVAIRSAIQTQFEAEPSISDPTTTTSKIDELVREIESKSAWKRLFPSSSTTAVTTPFVGYNERHQTLIGHALIGLMASSLLHSKEKQTASGVLPTSYLFDLSCIAAEQGLVHFSVPFVLINLMESHAGDHIERIMSKTISDHKWTVPLYASVTSADTARKLLIEMEQLPHQAAPTIDWEIFAICTLTRQEGEQIISGLCQSGYYFIDNFLRDRQTLGRITGDKHVVGDNVIRYTGERCLEEIEARVKEMAATHGRFIESERVRRMLFGGGGKMAIGLSGIVQALKIQLCYRLNMALQKFALENQEHPFSNLPASQILVPEAVDATSFLEGRSSTVSWPSPLGSSDVIAAVYFFGGSEKEFITRTASGGIRFRSVGPDRHSDVLVDAVRDRLLLFLPNKVSFEQIHGNIERFELSVVFSDESKAQSDKAFYLNTSSLMALSESDTLEVMQQQLANPRCSVCQKPANSICPVCRRSFYCSSECTERDKVTHGAFCVPFQKQPHFKHFEEAHKQIDLRFQSDATS